MKKIGFLALALCVAGAASAVTFDWSSDHQIGTTASGSGVAGATSGAISAPYISTAGSVIYYGAAVTGKGPGSDVHRVVFGIGDGTKNTDTTTSNQSISVNIGQDGKLYLYQNGAGNGVSAGTSAGTSLGSTTDAVLAANGADASTSAYLVLAIDRTNADGNATVTLYSSDADGSLNEVLITANNVSITGELDTVYAVDYYGQNGGSMWGVGDSVEVYATLPEPTVLALLALGVAGVALRRRVA